MTRGQNVVLLIGVFLLGLAHASCARVQSHYQLPQLAAADPSFLLTMAAYTTPAHAGNTVDVLLNGDQIFPAALEAIRSARKTITYAQYFYEEGPIGVEVAEALAERCRAGVQTHILLDGFGIDNNIVRQASRSQFGTLLEAGIDIYEYQAALLHAKTMTVDGIWATIGSRNLDTRSFALNDEVNAVVYHNEGVGQLEKIFAEDLTYARKVDLEQWRSRGFVDRLLETLSVPVRGEL